MRLIELQERQTSGLVELDNQTVAELGALRKYLKVKPGRDGRYVLRAKQYVGAVLVGQTQIRIRSKVPAARLLYLLGFSDQDHWSDRLVTVEEADQLVPVMALLFAKQANRALDGGAPYGYRSIDLTGPALRGRLREADHMRRRRGLALPVEVRCQQHTLDVPENQILLTAARRLRSLGELTPTAQKLLHQCLTRLAGVSELPAGRPLPPTRAPRENHEYHAALRLARLVLSDRSAEMVRSGTADVPVTGFLLNMEKVFQDYLALALRRQLADIGWAGPDFYYLAPGNRLQRRPDVVFRRGDADVAILDAKYKSKRNEPAPTPDVNQITLYCLTRKAAHGYLIYAGRGPAPRSYEITGTGVSIHVRHLDISQDIPNLEADIAELAARLAAHGPTSTA